MRKPPNRKPNTICDQCGAPIYRRPSTLRINRGKHCGRACRNRAHPRLGPRGPNLKLRGANNPAWRGGVTYFKKKGNYTGVRYVRAPEWARPMARRDGYIMEHRLIVAEWCGFLLERCEVVNHIDHVPAHNARENLELWPSNADHKRAEWGRCLLGVANRIAA